MTYPLPGIYVDPGGTTVGVNVTDVAGNVAAAFHDPLGVSAFTMPTIISTPTIFYVAGPGRWLVNGQSIVLEGSQVGTITVPPAADRSGIYGSGIYGDVVIDSSQPASVYANIAGCLGGGGTFASNQDIMCRNFTVNAGFTWTPVGDRIFCVDTLTVNGIIDANGHGGFVTAGTGGGGAFSDPAGNGQTGATATSAAGNPPASISPNLMVGGSGGAGGSGTPNAGGAANPNGFVNGIDVIEALGSIYTLFGANGPLVTQGSGTFGNAALGAFKLLGGAGGSAGGGDGTNRGGHGGGGGGMVIIFARQITGNGTIRANGGAGGNAPTGNAGGGGGGGGGTIVIVSRSVSLVPTIAAIGGGLIPNTPPWVNNVVAQLNSNVTLSVAGGNGGNGVGTGVAGSPGGVGNLILIPG